MSSMVQGTIDEVLPTVANHPRKDDERAYIDATILGDGHNHGGWVDFNRVRAALSNQYGINVHSRLLAARYDALRRAGRIYRPAEGTPEAAAWPRIRSTDTAGRNAGKSFLAWRIVVGS